MKRFHLQKLIEGFVEKFYKIFLVPAFLLILKHFQHFFQAPLPCFRLFCFGDPVYIFFPVGIGNAIEESLCCRVAPE